jgi:putative peptidoglycan lipid II flippase
LFRIIGFIAIPIATTVSTWIIVFAYIFKFVEKDIHKFDNIFFRKIIKMFLSSTLMAIFLIYMISFLADKLIYGSSLKILYLFLIVGSSIVVYFLISVLIGSIKFGRKKNIII